MLRKEKIKDLVLDSVCFFVVNKRVAGLSNKKLVYRNKWVSDSHQKVIQSQNHH